MSEQNGNAIVPSDWTMMQQQATALVQSGFLPQSVNHPQKAVAIIMLGRELGIAPWAALTSINVIQGKPTVSPQLMLALINRSGQLEDMIVEVSPERAVVTMQRKGRHPHTEAFWMKDATAMGLASKDNWRKQPETMMKWRAVAACARVVFADVILGLYTPDEMGVDVVADDQGNMTIIDVKPEPVPTEAITTEKPLTLPTGAGIQPNRPTPPPASPQASPDQSAESVSDPLADFGMEQGATVITAIRPDEQTSDEDYKAYPCNRVLIQTKGKRRDFIFKSDDAHKFTVPEAMVNNLKTEVIMWSPGKPHDLPITVWVEARPDGDKWDVRSVSDEVAS